MTKSEVRSDRSPTWPHAAALLDTLRGAADRADLAYAAPPAVLSGGFYAELVRFRLAEAPPELAGDLVARIVPSPAAGAWEAAVQGAVAAAGFPTPAVRLTVPASGPLGRFLIVMDAVDGHPPMAGLGGVSVVADIPRLLRRLPHQLAEVAADLHRLDPGPLAAAFAALDDPLPLTTAAFVEEQAAIAVALGRSELAAAGAHLVETEPRHEGGVITHGDLHPFNLLCTEEGPVLLDWTVSRIAHPGFTVAFTELMLAHPPLSVPAPLGAALRPLARGLARRFLRSYRRRTAGTPAEVDDVQLGWHRKVHALRILVEVAGWEATGSRPRAHPWILLEPVARAELDLDPRPRAG